MIDLDKDIELYKSKVAFYESQNTRGEYEVTVRELKYVVELLETLRSEIKTMGDCISREALKNIMKCNLRSWGAQGVLVDEVMKTIDNAPPVEPDVETNTEVLVKDAYDHGYTDGWKERFGEPDGRQKGEWKLVEKDNENIDIVCPFCNSIRFPAYSHGYTLELVEDYLTRHPLPNFCEVCGADMRKGGTE